MNRTAIKPVSPALAAPIFQSLFPRSRSVRWTLLLCFAALLSSFCGTARAQEDGTTMLVREWSPATGRLIGWLPAHQVVLYLQLEDPHRDSQFDPNEAVSLHWINYDHLKGDVRVTPDPVEFQGHKWLPLERDVNLVRIKKRVFLIRGITFGESPYRRATKVASR